MLRPITLLLLMFSAALGASAQCPRRPAPGSAVADPLAIISQNGVLKANFTFETGMDDMGNVTYCYAYQNTEAPTLRLNPGEQIQINLQNQIQSGASHMAHQQAGSADPCMGTMTSFSTNIHFHGMNVLSTCHSDEVIHTLINPGDPPFHYQVTVPKNEPPGLYWYHPHPHSLTGTQILGGASGALIVEGIEKIKPEVAGLTERVLIVRQRANPNGDVDAGALTLNFIPATFPETLSPMLSIQPQEKQFWRVLNAAGATFLNLQVQVNGAPLPLQLIAVDGTPLKTDQTVKTIPVPPAGRVEFIVQGPAAGAFTTFNTIGANTGADGDPNPPQRLAQVTVSSTASAQNKLPAFTDTLTARRFADLAAQAPTATRHLYFSEDLTDPQNPLFYITVEGQTPKLYDPNDPPAIITKQGAVEDWIIQNKSQEIHAFHMHQLHFLVLARDGIQLQTPSIQDTVTVSPWDGISSIYPSVRVRMDFRYKESVGTFPYHCHILDHEDGGMMAKIQVDPSN